MQVIKISDFKGNNYTELYTIILLNYTQLIYIFKQFMLFLKVINYIRLDTVVVMNVKTIKKR